MTWLTTLFNPFTLNPAIAAAGVALVAAPIVIHLINRMRYRTVRFAAMEFLLQSQQKNRRRVLIEQLLLLLLRILIVVGVVLLIARLVLDPSLLASLRSGATTRHVVLLDDSGSMRNLVGETTAFDAAKTIVQQFAAEAARESDSQVLTLILLSQARENVAFFTDRALDDAFLNELDAKLANVEPTHQALDLRAGIEAARSRLLPERTGQRQLHLLSDFRQADWLDQPGLVSDVQALGKTGVAVNLVRVVGEQTPNLAVTTLGGDLGLAAAGVPVRVKVGVTNFGVTVAENVNIGVSQDDQKLPVGERFAKIDPGKQATTEFDIVFATPGKHTLRLELAADALPSDDLRYAAVEVAASDPVLVIDGTAGQGDGPGLLADALLPAPGLTGLAPRIEPVDFLRRSPLDEFPVIFLVNVPNLPPDAVRALQNYVQAGGGLGWFLGDAVQPEFYNRELVNNANPQAGGPLFPVALAGSRVTRQANPQSSAVDVEFRPAGRFTPFAGPLRKYFAGLFIESLLPVAEDWERDDARRADGVITVATLRGGEPLILEHRLGAGKIVTVLTGAGQAWSNWPRKEMYIPFVQELYKELAKPRGGADSVPAGTPFAFTLPAAEYDPVIRIERPDGTPDSLRATPQQTDAAQGDLVLRGVYANTDQPGVYKLLTAPAAGGSLLENWRAVNVPLSESALTLAEPGPLRKALAGAQNVMLRDPGDVGWLRVREAGREARYLLIALLVGLLVAEQALAYRLSYHRRGV